MLLASHTMYGDLTCDHGRILVLAVCTLQACTTFGTLAVSLWCTLVLALRPQINLLVSPGLDWLPPCL